MKDNQRWWYRGLTAAFSIILILPHFYHFIFYPNKYSTNMGGDGLVTFYDMMYHTKHGRGFILDGMNYPDGELIFMTDANGSFAMAFQWLQRLGFNVADYIPGIYMYIVILGLVAAAVVMYEVLRHFKITPWVAILCAPIIILLSPQMLRIIPHYSQAFPIVIPLSLLWFLNKVKHPHFQKRDIFFYLFFFFITLNNTYIGIISMGAGVLSSILYALFNKSVRKSQLLYMILPIAVIVLACFLVLKLGDPFDDRLEIQWGFFAFSAQLAGFIYPDFSLLREFISQFKEMKSLGFEPAINLGLVPLALLLYFLVSKYIFRKHTDLKPAHPFKYIMIAAVLMTLFAMTGWMFPFLEDLGEEALGPLIMFKAAARFAWPLYFAIAILAVNTLDFLFKNISTRWLSIALPLLFMTLWWAESNWFLNQKYMETRYDNIFIGQEYEDLTSDLAAHSIDLDNYQAMFLLPLDQAWHENIISRLNWNSEVTGFLSSYITGIPMINSKLSRNSTEATLRSTQMVSSPLIKKRVLDILPEDKPILLVTGRGEPQLNENELLLLQEADTIYSRDRYTLHSLDIEKYTQYTAYKDMREKVAQGEIGSPKYPYIVDHFSINSDTSIFLNTHGILPEGKGLVFKDLKINHPEGGMYQLSLWYYMTSYKYGAPFFHIYVDDGRDFRSEFHITPRDHRNVYKNWLRTDLELWVPQGPTTIKIIHEGNQDFIVDEFLLHDKRDTIVFSHGDQHLVNGFIIE